MFPSTFFMPSLPDCVGADAEVTQWGQFYIGGDS